MRGGAAHVLGEGGAVTLAIRPGLTPVTHERRDALIRTADTGS